MKLLVSICLMFIVIFLFHYYEIFLLKFYPVCANLAVFLVFFISLFKKETIIQKFAKKVEGQLSEGALKYTRNLTVIWACLTFFNFVVSLITVFMEKKVWIVFNGFVSYLLIGALFFIEYIIRVILKKKHII